MDERELNDILEKHRKWIDNEPDGERADLQRADLQGADLQGAYLRWADLQRADLQGAYLRGVDLQRADLRQADLQGADLQGADLQGADLRWAYLQGADLRGAYLDFSCWPWWCGSKNVKVDMRLVYQHLAHIACLDCDDKEFQTIKEFILPYAQKCHRAEELGLLEVRSDKYQSVP